ncbi:hypothetical protein PFDG_01943 [Plasmodium falciparum Dd2]|uniref:Uncharacterized protein n=1 Tax=Plasmodium falciparum (isolate Dd2) TaxID=57267 RepID=A0A0L7M1L6_PLAF4|nr:hypothetical protein PFDG_01943 [Plasmodium falciparum Dd2]
MKSMKIIILLKRNMRKTESAFYQKKKKFMSWK